MASSVSVKVDIDEKALRHAISYAPGMLPVLSKRSATIAGKANALAAGFRTGTYHDHATGETRGNTPAHYDSNARMGSKGYVGLVYPANYSAQKENHLHNTLLKAKG